MCHRRMFTCALPVKGSPTATPMRKTASSYDATEPMPVKPVE
jgi:hypothetical protein